MLDVSRADLVAGVAGSGTMGRGIVQVLAQCGACAVLEALHDFYQEPRYRPSPWLKRRARLGVSLLTAD